MARLAALGAEVRLVPETAVAFAVRDDAEAFLMVAELVRRAAQGGATAQMVVWADGADFVDSLAAQFDEAWAKASPVARRAEPPPKLPPA